MRRKYDRLARSVALAAAAAMVALTVALALDTGSALAADYQDSKHNLCEGTFSFPPCTEWGKHVTGENNLAVGDAMMPALTSGENNVALDLAALAADTTGSNNVATGWSALSSNTTGHDNIASGSAALGANTTGEYNIATGTDALIENREGSANIATGTDALGRNISGSFNLASGFRALESNTTGSFNLATGVLALRSNTEGRDNIASGKNALFTNTTGRGNVADGGEALDNNETGSFNVALGDLAGRELTSGSNNIDISNLGTVGESSTTRIGSEGKQTRTFIAGIWPNRVSAPVCIVRVDESGQLGCNPGETGPPGPEGKEGKEGAAGDAAIAAFASRAKVLSGNCLAYTGIGPAGQGVCAAKTSGYSSSTRLAPAPANGGVATNLYADSNAVVSGSDSVLVAVIDNTTGRTLLSCAVNSSNVNHCSNATDSGAAAAGDNIQVKIAAAGASGNEKLWRVTFRF